MLIRSLLIVLPAVAPLVIGEMAVACERCRLLGTTAYHDASIGGDDFDDALVAPPAKSSADDEGQASAQFAALSGSPVTFTYSYQNMFDGALKMPNGQPLPAWIIRESIEEALGLWASVVPLHFIEVEDDGRYYSQGSTQFGEIRFRHDYLGGPDPVIGRPVRKAQAYFPGYSGDNARDVEFDDGDRWQKNGTLTIPDILGAAIHEIGHTLGLAHSTVQQSNAFWYWPVYNSMGGIETHAEPKGASNMYEIFTRFTGPGSGFLYQDDINRIRQYYGAGVGSVTPLVPEPSTLALVFLAAGCWIVSRRNR